MGWSRQASRLIYNNDWISVHEDQVTSPTGSKHTYGRVHFKNTAVGIVPLDEDGNTWLVGQDRYTLDAYSWEIPMGGSEPDEDPVDTANRELREETGIKARQMECLMELHTSNSITDERGLVYVARELEFCSTQFDEMEDLQIKKLPLSEAINWALDGKITDAISVAALLKLSALADKS